MQQNEPSPHVGVETADAQLRMRNNMTRYDEDIYTIFTENAKIRWGLSIDDELSGWWAV